MTDTRATVRFNTRYTYSDVHGYLCTRLKSQLKEDTSDKSYYIQISCTPTDKAVKWPIIPYGSLSNVTLRGWVPGDHKLITGEYKLLCRSMGRTDEYSHRTDLLLERQDGGYAVSMRSTNFIDIQIAWQKLRQGDIGKPVVAYEPMPVATPTTPDCSGSDWYATDGYDDEETYAARPSAREEVYRRDWRNRNTARRG